MPSHETFDEKRDQDMRFAPDPEQEPKAAKPTEDGIDLDVDADDEVPADADIIELDRRITYAVQGPTGATVAVSAYGFGKDNDAGAPQEIHVIWQSLRQLFGQTFYKSSKRIEWSDSSEKRWDE